MEKWVALTVCALVGMWALYSLALGDQVISPAGGAIVPPVGSGLFSTIRYQESSGTLTLIFKSGYGYEYYDVPRPCYQGFIMTGTKGAYFNSRIRGQFPCRRIDGGCDAGPGRAESG